MYATNILDPKNHTTPAVRNPDINTSDINTSDIDNRDISDDLAIDSVFDEIVHDELLLDDDADVDAVPVTPRTPQARCADGHGTLTHLFFSDVPLDTARAKAICGKCALVTICLDGALERAEPWGVWGGELIENGRIVLNKRPRGRPPKHPRPVVVIDEVPIPPHLVA
jgi:Transcription factor WhiB